MEHLPVYRLVLGISDAQLSSYTASAIDNHSRFEIVATEYNAVLTQTAAGQTQPDVILLSDHSPGIRGSALLGELASIASNPLVILTISGDDLDIEGEIKPTYAIADHDFEGLRVALDSTAALLDNPHEQPERRGGDDRRVEQDWSKVFAERRVSVRRDTDGVSL